MTHQIAVIARYTLLEAARTRLPHVAVAAAALLGAVSVFVASIALTETTRMQLGTYAASARLAAVFVAALYALSSIAREFNDKGLELLLALDLPRSHYILGKLAGLLAAAALLAAVTSIPLAFAAPFEAILIWAFSLALELGIVMALALFCAMTFRHTLGAASFVFGFYLLARVLTAVRLMSAHPLADADSAFHHVSQRFADGLALLVPSLDDWTQTAWLVTGAPAGPVLLALTGKTALYIALLTTAALVDFYRKNL